MGPECAQVWGGTRPCARLSLCCCPENTAQAGWFQSSGGGGVLLGLRLWPLGHGEGVGGHTYQGVGGTGSPPATCVPALQEMLLQAGRCWALLQLQRTQRRCWGGTRGTQDRFGIPPPPKKPHWDKGRRDTEPSHIAYGSTTLDGGQGASQQPILSCTGALNPWSPRPPMPLAWCSPQCLCPPPTLPTERPSPGAVGS